MPAIASLHRACLKRLDTANGSFKGFADNMLATSRADILKHEKEVAELESLTLSKTDNSNINDVGSSLSTAVDTLCRAAGVPPESATLVQTTATMFISQLQATLEQFQSTTNKKEAEGQWQQAWKTVLPTHRHPRKEAPSMADQRAAASRIEQAHADMPLASAQRRVRSADTGRVLTTNGAPRPSPYGS